MDRTYVIPANYLDSGYILNGRFAVRNAIEAIILGIIGFIICSFLPIPHNWDGITYYILIIVPLMMLGAVGVQEGPLSVFLYDAYKWLKKKKPYFYNNHGTAYHVSSAQITIDEPNIRDILIDKLDQVRQTMKAPKIEYVEGENFEFASDPELEALRDAERRLFEHESNDSSDTQSAAHAATEHVMHRDSLDVDEIIEDIVIHDLNNGGS